VSHRPRCLVPNVSRLALRCRLIAVALALVVPSCGSDANDAAAPATLTLVSLTPADGAEDVSVGAVITATFDEPLDPGTVDETSFVVEDPAERPVSGTVTVSATEVSFRADEPLDFVTEYTVSITRAIASPAGERLPFLHVAHFTTERDTAGAPPAPTRLSATLVDGVVQLSWMPAPRAQSYHVYWSTEPDFTLAQATLLRRVSRTETAFQPTRAVSYYFAVTAVNPSWESSPSAVTNVDVPGDNGVWNVELVDSEGVVGTHSAIVANPDGSVTIAYRDESKAMLEMVTNASGAWVAEEIDSMSDVDTSLARAVAGTLHVLYVDGLARIRHGENSSGDWTLSTIDDRVEAADVSLDVRPDGTAVAAYGTGVEPGPIYVATEEGDTWSIVSAPFRGLVSLALVLDREPGFGLRTFVPAYDPGYFSLAEIGYNGAWIQTGLGSASPAAGSEVAVAVDSQGDTQSIAHDAQGLIYYVSRSSTSRTIAHHNDASVALSIAIGPEDIPHMLYYLDVGLHYATIVDGALVSERIDGPGAGGDNAIAVGPDGLVHVSYFDANVGGLKYAIRR